MSGPHERRPRFDRLLPTVAAGTLILAAACTVATPPEATPFPTSSPVVTAPPSTPSPTSVVLPGDSWALVEGWPPPGAFVNAVAAGGPGWVAVGAADEAATAWISADGRSWTPSVPVSDVDPDTGDILEFQRVAWDGAFLYATAKIIRLTRGESHPNASVWRSKDGAKWEVVGSGDLFDLGPCLEGCPSLEAVAAGIAGIGLLGNVVTDEPGGSLFWWFSRDGAEWQRLPQSSFSARDGASVFVADVAAGGPGFVAAGEVCDPACRGTTWASQDGRTWTEGGALPHGEDAHPGQVVADANGFVVLGGTRLTDESGQVACKVVAWSSADLTGWSETTIDGCDVRLAESGGLLLLVGFAEGRSAVWTSSDGATWERRPPAELAEFAECGFGDLAGGPLGAILVGDRECPSAWITPGG